MPAVTLEKIFGLIGASLVAVFVLGTTKAAVKMHTLLDLRGNIPSFIHISDGKLHDVHALDMLLPEAGAIYVVDRGYVDFARLYVLHQAGAFFVTRAKSNIDAHRVYSAPTDPGGKYFFRCRRILGWPSVLGDLLRRPGSGRL